MALQTVPVGLLGTMLGLLGVITLLAFQVPIWVVWSLLLLTTFWTTILMFLQPYTEWELIGIPDREGNGVSVQAMGRDITIQKQLEREQGNLSLVVEHTDNSVVLTDAEGIVLWANDAFRRMTGLTCVEGVDTPLWTLLDSGCTPTSHTMQQLRQAIKNRHSISMEYQMCPQKDASLWLDLNLKPLRDEDMQVSRFFMIAREITEQKRHTESLERLTQELTRSNHELSEFAYIVSHNLRAPVANIIGLTEILDSQVSGNKETKPVFAHLHHATTHLDSVIRDLMGLLEMRQGSFHGYQVCSFKDLVHWTNIQLRSQFDNIGPDFETDFSELPSLVTIEPYLQGILQNLMSNSFKYRHPDRRLHILLKSGKEGDHYTLMVRDNGLGIDLKAHGKELFQLYRRFHNHTDGKGLGLYMVKSQVTAMGGTIDVESQPDQGATFYIRLPERTLSKRPHQGKRMTDQ